MQNNNIDILGELENSLDFNSENKNTVESISETEETVKTIDIFGIENIEEKNLEIEKTVKTIDIFALENTEEKNSESEKTVKTIDIFALENIEEKKYETVEFAYKIKKTKNSFFSGILFLGKYILTTTLIFAILLVVTNYSAYINVAKSYVFSGEMKNTQQKLISSVEATNIKDKYSEVVKEEIENEEIENKKLSIKQMIKEQDKENINLDIEITPYENRIIIPKIGKNIPLLDIKNRKVDGEKELNDIFMEELENGVIRYPGSAKPGDEGTSFIFGHSSNFPWIKGDYNDVFALLDKVVYDDQVIVYYGQEKYIYKIKEKKVITPGDVSVLERNKKKSEITLMTCRPIGTTLNRLIVTGELVEIK